MKMNHMLKMMLACAIPLLVISLLPVFGIKSDYTVFIFVALMIMCHLFMMSGHGHEHKKKDETKEGKHGKC